MVKKTYDPVSTESNVTETPELFKLKGHKHYYMPEGNVVIPVNGSVTLNVIQSELKKKDFTRLQKHCLNWILTHYMLILQF